MLFKVFAAAENIFYFFQNVHKDDDDDNDDDSNESTNTKPFCSKPTFLLKAHTIYNNKGPNHTTLVPV